MIRILSSFFQEGFPYAVIFFSILWYNPFHTRSWIFVPAAAGVRIFARDMLRMTPVNAQAGTIEKGQEMYGLL